MKFFRIYCSWILVITIVDENMLIGWKYIENMIDNNLMLRKNYEFKKSLSSQKLLMDNKRGSIKDFDTNLNSTNHSNYTKGNNIDTENYKPFSKISRLGNQSKHLGKIIEDYQLKYTEKAEK